jgi:hypothetical protein
MPTADPIAAQYRFLGIGPLCTGQLTVLLRQPPGNPLSDD